MGEVEGLKVRSHEVTDGYERAPARAMLRAVGLGDEDFAKSQIGIVSAGNEVTPCNLTGPKLAGFAKEGVRESGGVGLEFATIAVSDGISMGTEGMSYSLPSRDLIADSIETVMRAQWYDANISIPGCDKNMPGVMMAMGRVNRPALMVYGGTIRAGSREGDDKLDIVSAFQCYGEFLSGHIDDDERVIVIPRWYPRQAPFATRSLLTTSRFSIEGSNRTSTCEVAGSGSK